jgi:hypothetical protein
MRPIRIFPFIVTRHFPFSGGAIAKPATAPISARALRADAARRNALARPVEARGLNSR